MDDFYLQMVAAKNWHIAEMDTGKVLLQMESGHLYEASSVLKHMMPQIIEWFSQ